MAVALEVTPVKNEKPMQQQQQQQQKQRTDSASNGSKRGYQPSISKPGDNTCGGQSCRLGSNKHGKSGGKGQSSGLLPAAWVSMEIFERWCSTGKCLQCRSLDDKASFCPSVNNGSGYPDSGLVLDPKNGSVRLQTRTTTWHADSWQAKHTALPVNPQVLPSLARPSGSDLWFYVLCFPFVIALRYANANRNILTFIRHGLFVTYWAP